MNTEIIIIHLMQTEGIGPRTLTKLIGTLQSEGRSLEYLLEADEAELAEHYRLPVDLADRVAADRDEIRQLVENLESRGVRMIIYGAPDYPAHLNVALDNLAPPVLFAAGEMALLSKPSVAVCGARKVTPGGREATIAIVMRLAEEGVNTISGSAVGVDRAAHAAAIRADGVTSLVLPTGILRSPFDVMMNDPDVVGRLLVVSEFHPTSPWSAWTAMQRNNTVIGLADAVIAVEPAGSGGTFEAARTALKMERPLFLVVHPEADDTTEGNRYFLRRGARPIRFETDQETDVGTVLEATLQQHAAR